MALVFMKQVYQMSKHQWKVRGIRSQKAEVNSNAAPQNQKTAGENREEELTAEGETDLIPFFSAAAATPTSWVRPDTAHT